MSVATTASPNQPPSLDAALGYTALGLRVVPIGPGAKHPVGLDSWQTAATTDPAIVTSWFTGLYRGHGVGIATGAESGVWVLDIDVADGKHGDRTLADLEDAYGPLPPTVEAITGTGGRHLYFAWDADHPVRNNQSGKVGAGIDVRGEGGQVLAAPTIHPNGTPYRWAPGRAPGEIAFAPAPGWLHALLEIEPEPPTPPRPTLTVVSDDEDSPAAQFNASTTWEQLLTRDGWTLGRTMGSGEQRWTRPGKSARDGISATVGHGGRDVLKVFTSSVPELRADEAYSRFGYEAAVAWNGDRSAFAAHLRRQMNEAAGRGRGDLSDLTDMTWLGDTVKPSVFDEPAAPAEPIEEWAEPERLEPEITHGAPFPLDTLPRWIARQVEAVAASYQVPEDLPAMFALGALSAVVMGHVKVRVTGSDWVEYTNLYLTAALPPGAGKTPAFKAMTRCVNELEAELVADTTEEIREATIRRAVLEQQAKAAFNGAAMKSEPIEKAIAAQAELDALVIPATPRLLADDATPQSLAVVMAENGGRMNLLSDEGDVFDIMAGRYNQQGSPTDLSPYLKGHSAGAIKQDRIGRAKVSIPEALLTVCVATQPRVLAKLGENPELAGRGLSARFMYCVPRSNVGWRDRYAVLGRRDAEAQQTYDSMVKDIARSFRRFTLPGTIDLAIEARDLFLEWDQSLEAMLRPDGDLAPVAEWAMKLRASVLRLAGLLHVADGASGEISAGVMERALTVGDYWIDHALKVHAVWGGEADSVMRRARQIIAWATKPGAERQEFTAREAYIECRNRDNRVKVDGVNESIARLASMGWVRTPSDFPGSKGKKSPTITLHPEAIRLHAHNAQVDEVARSTPSEGSDVRVVRVARKGVYAFSTTTYPQEESPDGFANTSTRNAHNAQVAEDADPPSPPLPVAEAGCRLCADLDASKRFVCTACGRVGDPQGLTIDADDLLDDGEVDDDGDDYSLL